MGKAGVLIISHGSRSSEWVEGIDQAAAEVRFSGYTPGSVPVYAAFLELVEGRLIQDGIDALEAQGVTDLVVVPLFISCGSTHVEEIRYALGDLPSIGFETELEPFRLKAAVHVCSPLDDDPVVAEIVWDKLRTLSRRPELESVLLVGHGSELPDFYDRWKRGMDSIGLRLRELGGFREVHSAVLLPDETREAMLQLLADGGSQTEAGAEANAAGAASGTASGSVSGAEAEHEGSFGESCPSQLGTAGASSAMVREDAAAAGKDGNILVAPLFLSSGYFTNTVIPKRLQGMAYRYNGQALLPHPAVSRWIGRVAGELLGRINNRERL